MEEQELVSYLSKDQFIYTTMLALLVEKIGKCADVLEHGCGTGTFYQYMRDCKELELGSYAGMDATEKVVKIAQRLFADDPVCTFSISDIREPPTKTYATTIVKDLFEHLPDYRLALIKILSATRNYSLLAFFNSVDGPTSVNPLEPNYYFNCLSKSELEEIFSRYGFYVMARKSYPELSEVALRRVLQTCPNLAQYQQGHPTIYLLVRGKL